MADIITSVKDARFSLSTKETFYQIKADQKAIMTNSKTHEFSSAYNTAYDVWYNSPRSKDGQHISPKPQRPWILDCSARSMNIIYGMLKGHSYREIEKTYREHNGPDKESISKVLAHYSINEADFYDACGEIDYE